MTDQRAATATAAARFPISDAEDRQDGRLTRRAFTAGLLGAGASAALSGCGTSVGDGRREVVVWTNLVGVPQNAAQAAIAKKIMANHPDLHVKLVPNPGSAPGDLTKLITAVRGHVAPDLIVTDDLSVGEQAALGLIREMGPYVEEDKGRGAGDITERFLPFARNAGIYNERLYAIPTTSDARGLFYNKEMLRKNGVDLARFDMANGPLTIDELMDISRRINRRDRSGHYTQMGFIPWESSGQTSPTTWTLAFGGSFFDNRTCTVPLDSGGIREYYEALGRWVEELDYTEVNLFEATYSPPNAPPGYYSFTNNRLATHIGGDWEIGTYRQYTPHLDYGVTWLPVARKGQKPFSWSGVWMMALPKGSKNPDDAWTVAKEFAGAMGQRQICVETTALPTYVPLIDDPTIKRQQGVFTKILKHTTTRTTLPVGGFLWDAMTTAQQAVQLGDQTPREALRYIKDRVQPQLDAYCPLSIPAGTGPAPWHAST